MSAPPPAGVEVSYALPERAIVRRYDLSAATRLGDLLRRAAADPAFAEVDFARAAVGIFGRPAGPDTLLSDGDRVEIYRPLAADPKLARRARARQARLNKSGRS